MRSVATPDALSRTIYCADSANQDEDEGTPRGIMGLCPRPRRGVRALPEPLFMRISGHAPGKAPGSPCPEMIALAGATDDTPPQTESCKSLEGRCSRRQSRHCVPAAGAEHDLWIEAGARASMTFRCLSASGVGALPSRQRELPLSADGEPGASPGASAEA